MRLLAVSALALAVLSGAGAASAASLIVNGGFEGRPGPDGDTILPSGSTDIAGWTTANQGVEWFTPDIYGGQAPEGSDVVDLAWYTSSGDPGGAIEQTVATTAGGHYLLTFKGGTSTFAGRDGTGIIDLLVNGAAAQSFNLTNLSDSFPASSYQSFSYGFVASGPATTLRFANTQNAFEHFAFLDDVALAVVVPEPASWSLMILGFGAAGAILRRRRSIRSAAA